MTGVTIKLKMIGAESYDMQASSLHGIIETNLVCIVKIPLVTVTVTIDLHDTYPKTSGGIVVPLKCS